MIRLAHWRCLWICSLVGLALWLPPDRLRGNSALIRIVRSAESASFTSRSCAQKGQVLRPMLEALPASTGLVGNRAGALALKQGGCDGEAEQVRQAAMKA